MGIVPIALEGLRTKQFAWYFERDYLTRTDTWVGTPLIVVTMGLIFLYFAYPLVRGRQTIGDYLMQIQIVRMDATTRFSMKEACSRTWFGFRGLCGWPLSLLRGEGKRGLTWYDKRTNTRVVHVQNAPLAFWID
jgi:hypothetical protein